MMLEEFRISDLNFQVTQAELDAYIDEDERKLCWGVSVEAVLNHWRPRAYSEILCKTRKGEIQDWRGLSGRKIRWKAPVDKEGEPHAVLYAFEHNPIYRSSLEFVNNSNQLWLRWQSRCDLNWDEKYGRNLELSINTELVFSGIWLGKMSESQAIELAKQYIDVSALEFEVTENGVSRLCPALGLGKT